MQHIWRFISLNLVKEMNFTGKTILVTGGTSGIGLGVVKRMSELGARVGVIARNAERGLQVMKSLPCVQAEPHIFLAADAADPQSFLSAMEEMKIRFDHLDFVFHSIGMDCRGKLEDLDISIWDQTMNTNLRSAYLLLHSLLPKMLEQRQGVIVFNSSNKGILAHADDPIYCASKAGLNMLMQSTALRVARQGVRINSICPGPVRTPLLIDEKQIAANVPMNRVVEVEEIADLVAFLFSDAASYIHGTAIPVDGGKSAGHNPVWVGT